MSAQGRSGRVWFAGLAALALVLVGVASGAHLGSWRAGSVGRTSASAATAPLVHHARAVDTGSHLSHAAAPQQLDPSTPPDTDLRLSGPQRHVATVSLPHAPAGERPAEHPGRAPPTA